MLTFAATKKLSTCANGQKAEAEFPFCPRSFDRAVMVSQWYDLRLGLQVVTREIGFEPCLGLAGGHVTTRSTSPRFRRSLMLTFATKKLSTGANGQKAEAEFPFCPRSFDRAVMRFENKNSAQ